MKTVLSVFSLGLLLVLWPVRIEAGYSVPRLGITAIPLGAEEATKEGLDFANSQGQPYPPLLAGLDAAYIARLRQFGDFKKLATDAEVIAKIVGTRITVLCAIEVIQLQHPELGACLAQLHRAGRLCLGFADNLPASASIQHDGSKECGNEPINIYEFPCGYVPIYDPMFFTMLNSLAHEALHALQQWHQGPEPITQDDKAHFLLILQCNEADAERAEFDRIRDLDAVLTEIENNARLPAEASGMAARIGAAILNDAHLTNAEKKAAATKLRKTLVDLREQARLTLECRETYKRALELFLQGGPNRTAIYNQSIRPTGWFRNVNIRNIGGFGAFQITYTAGGGHFIDGPNGPASELVGDAEFAEFGEDGEQRSFTIPGVDFISDAFIYPNGQTFLVVGTGAGNMGLIYGGRDANDDGYFDPATLTKIFDAAELGGGLRFVWNGSNKSLLGVNRSTGMIFSFGQIPADSNLFPTAFTPAGSMGPRGDLLEFWMDPQGDTVFGAPALGSPLSPYDDYTMAHYDPLQGEWEPAGRFEPFANAIFRPAFGETLTTVNYVCATGPPNRLLELWAQPPGAPDPAFLTAQQTSHWGKVFIDLTTPLQAGTRLFTSVADGTSNIISVSETVTAPRDLDIDIRFDPQAAGSYLLVLGAPYQEGTIEHSDNLSDWIFFQDMDVGGFGRRLSALPPTGPGNDGDFFRFVARSTAPVAVPDDFTIPAAGTYRVSVLGNDTAPPGTRAVLVNPVPLHPDLFTWSGDGNFSINPLAGSASLDFSYRLQSHDGQISNPAQVTLTFSPSLVTTLPVQPGVAGDYVPVPCLLLSGGTAVPFALNYYPLYQFRLSNSPRDVCTEPHWHWRGQPVYFISGFEPDMVGQPDPDEPRCGFGLERDIPEVVIDVPVADYQSFLAAHPEL